MVRFNMSRINRYRRAKCLRRFSSRARSEQVHSALAEFFGIGRIGCGHGFL
jgi:hypothetical protein